MFGSLSYGYQKRVLILKLPALFMNIDHNLFMRKILAPKHIKIIIFKFLQSGLYPDFYFDQNFDQNGVGFCSILANIFLNGIELLHSCIRFGNEILIFLKPNHNEKLILKKFVFFLHRHGIDFEKCSFLLIKSTYRFDFLKWSFKVGSNNKFYCSPSFEKYKAFKKQVNFILNNSNYGAKTKANKLFPIINDWRNSNKFCNTNNSKYSLFLQATFR